MVPCWPEIWSSIKDDLPKLALLTSLLAYISLLYFLFRAPWVRAQWLRMTLWVLGGIGVLPLVALVAGVLLGVLMNLDNPRAKTRVVQSPKGQRAELIYHAGFLGRDYTEVTLKRTGCCGHSTVFWHQGPSWIDDPKLEWIDNRELDIVYHARPDDRRYCEDSVAEIKIVCIAQVWPDVPAPR